MTPDPEPEIKLTIMANSKRTAPKILARKLTELLESGATPEEAAQKMGVGRETLNQLVLSRQFQELLTTATFSADVQRALVRAARVKVLGHTIATGLEEWTDINGRVRPGDPAMIKLALEATKQIASDPEIGLQAPPQTTINLTFEKSQDLLDKTEPIPGFENVTFLDEETDGPDKSEE